MKRNALWALALVLSLGLIAAGCGGDDDDDGGDSLSKEEFVTQANEICSEGNAEIQQAGEDLQGEPGTDDFEAFVSDTLIPNVQGQIDDIRALGPPEEDADQINGILDEAEGVLDELEADPSQLGGGADPFAEINAQLEDYGLTACA